MRAADPNVVPSRYRQVAVAAVPNLDPGWLAEHFTGREVYFRTRFIVARHADQVALVEVERGPSEDLFANTVAAWVVAGADDCAVVVDETLDTAVPSQLAAAAERVPESRCAVVEGLYSHVSFILNPDPVRIRLVDVIPPGPAKLLDQVRRVLAGAEDLPPIVVEPDLIDSRDLLAEAYDRPPQDLLIPCRGSGMDFEGSNGYGYEFDTYSNSQQTDPNDQHIGVIQNSAGNHLHYETMAPNELEDGGWHRIRVSNTGGRNG